MTPKFTTPCYVRVDDKDKRNEVCDKLEKIGYTPFRAINRVEENIIVTDVQFSNETPISPPDYFIWPYRLLTEIRKTHFDCGTNTELFLALAEMRSDTDKGQWFVVDEPISIGTQILSIGAMFNLAEDKFNNSIKAHRATATEIIEHFKKIKMELVMRFRKQDSGAIFITPSIVYYPKGNDAPRDYVFGFQIHWLNLAIAIHGTKKLIHKQKGE